MNTIPAFVGLTSLNSKGGFPTPVGATSDLVAGTSIAYAALLAVRRARTTGAGAHIDLSMAETTMSLMGEPFMAHFAGEAAAPIAHVPQNVYRTRGDDKWIALSVRTDEQWANLVRAMGSCWGWLRLDNASRTARECRNHRHAPSRMDARLRQRGTRGVAASRRSTCCPVQRPGRCCP